MVKQDLLVAQGVREHFEVFLESFSSEPASALSAARCAARRALSTSSALLVAINFRAPLCSYSTRPRRLAREL